MMSRSTPDWAQHELAPLLAMDGSTLVVDGRVRNSAGDRARSELPARHVLTVAGPLGKHVEGCGAGGYRIRRFFPAPGLLGDLVGRARSARVSEAGIPSAPRPVDLVASAGDLRLDKGQLELRDGGFLWIGRDIVVRGGQGGRPGGFAIQQSLSEAGHQWVPDVFDAGVTEGWWYVIERRMPGETRFFLTGRRVREVASSLCALDPTPQLDLAELASHLTLAFPEHQADLIDLIDRVAVAEPAARPSHGDLWMGNCLWTGDELSAVVDWDRASRGGVAGADLLHLRAMYERVTRVRSIGASFRRRAWREWVVTTPLADEWNRLGLPAAGRSLDVIAAAWWLGAIGANAAHRPPKEWVHETVTKCVPVAERLLSDS